MSLLPLSCPPSPPFLYITNPRCSLVFHYASDVGKLSPASTKDLHISRAEEILNKEAGWKALTGTTNFGTIAAAAASGSGSSGDNDDDEDTQKKMRLAFDLLVDRISAFIGSYYVTLRGRVDALVFAGGIGERSAALRAAVVDQVGCLGFTLDGEANEAVSGSEEEVQDVGKPGVTPRVLVCRTDEQFEMARMCAEDEEFW